MYVRDADRLTRESGSLGMVCTLLAVDAFAHGFEQLEIRSKDAVVAAISIGQQKTLTRFRGGFRAQLHRGVLFADVCQTVNE